VSLQAIPSGFWTLQSGVRRCPQSRPYLSRYERSLRPSLTCFSRPEAQKHYLKGR
jgi:hypothetical protein